MKLKIALITNFFSYYYENYRNYGPNVLGKRFVS